MNTIALHQILTDPLSSYKDKEKAQQLLRMNNFSESITLLSYCIMPNHYHMLIHQEEMDAIDRFMNSLWTRYTMYFNRKYRRVGPLFQDVYKAVLVTSDEQLLHLSRYIHLNPIAKRHFRNPASKGDALRGYNFCSYQECLGLRHTPWVKPETILNYFGKTTHKSYQDFVEGFEADENTARIIHPVIIEI